MTAPTLINLDALRIIAWSLDLYEGWHQVPCPDCAMLLWEGTCRRCQGSGECWAQEVA